MAIHFTIERAGHIFNARADGAAPFFVGCQTSYRDKSSGDDFEGIYNVPRRELPKLMYKAMRISRKMPIQPALLTTAANEWKRWGFSTVPIHGQKSVGGRESEQPYVQFVNNYWTAVGKPNRNGKSPYPWSAAFISYCFETAAAGPGFPYNEAHWGYCQAILAKPNSYPKLKLLDPTSCVLGLGDLVWAARGGSDCPLAPTSFDDALKALRRGSWFCSHADVVVEVRSGEVDVIGGNVSDSVTKTTYKTVGGKMRDPRHAWLAVVRSTL
jgi:hypothetical protein